jgi:hypothetical protein
MEHEEAIATLAAEKYVLSEFSAEQREQFEEHFFSCPECAEDVRTLSQFKANARVVLGEPAVYSRAIARPARSWRWLDSISAWWAQPNYAWGTLAVLLAVTTVTGGLRVVELNKQLQPQAVSSFVLRPETRGEIISIAPQQLGPFVLLEVDVPGASGELAWELQSAGSKDALFTGTATAPPAGASFKLLLPSDKFGRGEYLLVISSPGAVDASAGNRRSYRFKIGES